MAQIYPQWWNQTITIFNKHTDPLTDMIAWYKHTVTGAFWKYTGEKVTIGKTVLETNTIICRIRKDDAFMENYKWIELPADVKPDYFTISKGDIIVKGEVNDEVNEYVAGERSSDLIKKYKSLQGCMVVSEYTINIGGGRYTEHYLVKGE